MKERFVLIKLVYVIPNCKEEVKCSDGETDIKLEWLWHERKCDGVSVWKNTN